MFAILLKMKEVMVSMLRTTPYFSMRRVLVLYPISAIVVKLVGVLTVFICANIWSKIVDEMCPANLIRLRDFE
jgi:hypothetical protein